MTKKLTVEEAKAFIKATGGQITCNFHLREYKCKDGTVVPEEFLPNVILLAQNDQIIRDELTRLAKKDAPLHINSGYRTPSYNAKLEGSAIHSQHLKAAASDITCAYFTPKQVADVVEKLISDGKIVQGGVGRYKGFCHYDVRGTRARWGTN